jgi:hypothetical protein
MSGKENVVSDVSQTVSQTVSEAQNERIRSESLQNREAYLKNKKEAELENDLIIKVETNENTNESKEW